MSYMYLKNKRGETIYKCEFTKQVDKDGCDLLQIVTDDLIFLIRPRKNNTPTLILFSPGIGKPVIAKQDDKSLAVEIFSDKVQMGIGANPITLSQKELLAKTKTTEPTTKVIDGPKDSNQETR